MAKREETGAPPRPAPAGAAQDVPALLSGDHPKADTILVSLLEMRGKARFDAIAAAVEKASQTAEHPVFLTDDLDLSVFSGERHFYEYLPSIAEQLRHTPAKRWDLYVAQKLRIILAKWRPARVESAGLSIEAFVGKVKAAHDSA